MSSLEVRGLVRPARSRAWRCSKLLGNDQAPNGQLVDLQSSDPRATDCQSTDGKCAKSCCTDCNRAQRKPAYRNRTGGDGMNGPWRKVHLFHALCGAGQTTSF